MKSQLTALSVALTALACLGAVGILGAVEQPGEQLSAGGPATGEVTQDGKWRTTCETRVILDTAGGPEGWKADALRAIAAIEAASGVKVLVEEAGIPQVWPGNLRADRSVIHIAWSDGLADPGENALAAGYLAVAAMTGRDQTPLDRTHPKRASAVRTNTITYISVNTQRYNPAGPTEDARIALGRAEEAPADDGETHAVSLDMLLGHELAHAFGLDHTSNTDSVMHRWMAHYTSTDILDEGTKNLLGMRYVHCG